MSERDILKSSLAATPECLSPEQLEALLDGKTSNPHLAQCPRCQAELAMLKAFGSGTPLPDEGAAVAWVSSQLDRRLESIKGPSRSRARSLVQNFEPQASWMSRIFATGGWRWAIPAGGLAVAAVMIVLLLGREKEPELQAHLGNSAIVYRSQEVQIVSPVGDVQQVPQSLQWQPFPGTGIYRVQVMEVDKSVLWSTETRETAVEVPQSLRVKILPGKPILWQVTALDSQGLVLGTSQLERFATPREHSSEKAN